MFVALDTAGVAGALVIGNYVPAYLYLLRGIYMQTPLRFKLSGRPVLSARLNVETARSERKRPEI